MATTYKVLGQVNPAATTPVSLYVCPTGTQTVISSITICNQGASDGTYRIAVRPDAAPLSVEHYVVFDATAASKTTTAYTIGITLNAADVITVYSSNATTSFNAFGSEIA